MKPQNKPSKNYSSYQKNKMALGTDWSSGVAVSGIQPKRTNLTTILWHISAHPICHKGTNSLKCQQINYTSTPICGGPLAQKPWSD